MNTLRTIISFLGSRSLTLWLSGVFILSYVTIAVWLEEAFAAFATGLTTNVLIMFAYLLFSVNVLLRSVTALRRAWPQNKLLLLKLPLYAGMVLVLFSFFFSLNLREYRWMIVGEGDVFQLPWEESPFRVLRVDIPLSKNMLITKDSSLFAYEPVVTLGERNGAVHSAGAFPPARARSSLLHILNFGIGPGVELRNSGEIVQRGEVALRLLPFGNVDTFELPPYSYKFHVSIIPTRTVKKGRETANEYDLSHPRYRVEVVKGDKTITKTETEEAFSFDGRMSLRFYPPAPWVHLEAVRDPFRTWFIVGCGLLLIGALLLPVVLYLQRERP